MMANSGFKDLVSSLSKEELAGFEYICNTLDFASSLNKKSYVLETLNTSCSSLDTLTTGSRLVFNQENKTIAIETAGKIVETIVYEGEMIPVEAAALAVVRAGWSEGLYEGTISLAAGGGIYFLGSKGAKNIAEEAGVKTKELAQYLINKYENSLEKNKDQSILEDKTISNKQETTKAEKMVNVEIKENGQVVQKEVILLTEGQTISHIAQNTSYSSTELLEYNYLTLEEAKNLPVGYEVKIPNDTQNIQTTNQEKILDEKLDTFKEFAKVFMQDTEPKEDIEKLQNKIENIKQKENLNEKIKSLENLDFKDFTSNTYIDKIFSNNKEKIIEDSTTFQENTNNNTEYKKYDYMQTNINTSQNSNSSIQMMN